MDYFYYIFYSKKFLKKFIFSILEIFFEKILKNYHNKKVGENLTKKLKNDRVEKIIIKICDSIQITNHIEVIILSEGIVILQKEDQNQRTSPENFKNSEKQQTQKSYQNTQEKHKNQEIQIIK